MLRMHMNVFYLQQRLSSLLQTEEDEMQFERVYAFYALVEVRVPTLVRWLLLHARLVLWLTEGGCRSAC